MAAERRAFRIARISRNEQSRDYYVAGFIDRNGRPLELVIDRAEAHRLALMIIRHESVEPPGLRTD